MENVKKENQVIDFASLTKTVKQEKPVSISKTAFFALQFLVQDAKHRYIKMNKNGFGVFNKDGVLLYKTNYGYVLANELQSRNCIDFTQIIDKFFLVLTAENFEKVKIAMNLQVNNM